MHEFEEAEMKKQMIQPLIKGESQRQTEQSNNELPHLSPLAKMKKFESYKKSSPSS